MKTNTFKVKKTMYSLIRCNQCNNVLLEEKASYITDKPVWQFRHDDKIYISCFFCSSECLLEFINEKHGNKISKWKLICFPSEPKTLIDMPNGERVSLKKLIEIYENQKEQESI